jgi:hypothetical protein
MLSQTSNNYSHDSLIITKFLRRSLFGFSVSPYLVNKAISQATTGEYHLNTSYKYGFEAGFDYYFNINNSYSLVIGLHGGAAATNYKLFILRNDFNPSLGGDWDDNGQFANWGFYINVPFWIEKRWLTRSNNFWNIVAGVNVRYYPIRYSSYGIEEITSDVNGNEVKVLEIDALMGNNLRPWLNYNVGGGYSLLLRNNNYLQCNLLANFSNKKIVNGTYTINVTGKPQSTGKYSADMSYIGLSFSYILTGANKRMRKLYESKLK